METAFEMSCMCKNGILSLFFTFASIFVIIMLNYHPSICALLISEHAQWGPGGLEINDYGTTRISANNSLPMV